MCIFELCSALQLATLEFTFPIGICIHSYIFPYEIILNLHRPKNLANHFIPRVAAKVFPRKDSRVSPSTLLSALRLRSAGKTCEVWQRVRNATRWEIRSSGEQSGLSRRCIGELSVFPCSADARVCVCVRTVCVCVWVWVCVCVRIELGGSVCFLHVLRRKRIVACSTEKDSVCVRFVVSAHRRFSCASYFPLTSLFLLEIFAGTPCFCFL